MDRNFFYRCLLAVSDNSSRLFDDCMRSTIEKFDALRPAGASKVDVHGYSQLLADLSIIMATMAQNHLWTNLASRVLKYLRLGHPELKRHHHMIVGGLLYRRTETSDTMFDLTTPLGVAAQHVMDDLITSLPLPHKSPLGSATVAHCTLPLYFRILRDTEFVTGKSTPYKTRTFDLLPMKGGFTVSHIPISNMMFMTLLKKTGLETLQGDGRGQENRILWAK